MKIKIKDLFVAESQKPGGQINFDFNGRPYAVGSCLPRETERKFSSGFRTKTFWNLVNEYGGEHKKGCYLIKFNGPEKFLAKAIEDFRLALSAIHDKDRADLDQSLGEDLSCDIVVAHMENLLKKLKERERGYNLR